MTNELLSVEGVSISFATGAGWAEVVRDVSFAVQPGETVGIVGESGCGKSVTALSILGLLPQRTARVSGRIAFEGTDLLALDEPALRRVRGKRIGMIFQEPMTALDPVFTVGVQIDETVRTHLGLGKRATRERTVEALDAVGIAAPRHCADQYPMSLSGGMRQRVMIAMALVCEPRLVIADEPTTALDVTVQAQIIELLLDLGRRTGTALLFITHDLGVVAESCTRMVTMYAGEVVEEAAVGDVLEHPLHPYSSGLLRSLPRLSPRKTRLPSIGGRVPSAADMPAGCRFEPRCAYAAAECALPQTLQSEGAHRVRCCRHGVLSLPGAVA